MYRAPKRFPKSVLFARAAQLQQQIEFWMGETAMQQNKPVDPVEPEHYRKRLRERYEHLTVARANASRLRGELYECP